MRLAVEELFGGATLTDRPGQLSQCVAQKLAVCIPKIRGQGAVGDQPLRFRDAIREVGRRELGLPHASVQPFKHLRILDWSDLTIGQRLVVGPQRDGKAVSHVDARLHTRIEQSYRAVGVGEPTRDLDFELWDAPALPGLDASENVTRSQAKGEPVRVVKNNRVIDPQVEC